MRIINRTIESLAPTAVPYEVRDDDVKGFLARVQPTGRITYYFDYRDTSGKRQRIRLGTHGTISPIAAREAATKHAAEVALGKNVQAVKKQARVDNERAKHSTLRTFLEERYQPWVEAERKSGKATMKRLNKYFDSLMSSQLTEIDLWTLEKWRSERRKAGIKPSTINRDTAALKAMLSKAVEWNVIEHHPLQRLKPLRFDNKAKVRYLSPDEESRLRAALLMRATSIAHARESANAWRKARHYETMATFKSGDFVDHLAPMVLLSINTGMRRGELFQLTWHNVNLSRAILTVEGYGSKSGKTRHIPLNSEVCTILKKWKTQQLDLDGLVFPNSEGKRFDNVNTAWEGLLCLAKIKDFRWHDMRHHFASKLVMAEVDLNTVRELLGHSDLSMTLRYAHLAPEHKATAVEKLVGIAA